MAKYRILSLDGGGIRGIISAILMQRLNARPALAGWLGAVDLIAGTSTGGLLALALAAGLDPRDIRELYETKGRKIFDDSWLDDLVDLGKLRGAAYGIKNLRNELHKILGDRTLGELRKRVLITAFDLDNEAADADLRTWKPKIFHNFPGPDSDGGVYATNPSMCALAQSQDARIPSRPALADVVLLSLGTGTTLQYIKGQALDWGYAQWAVPLVSLMLDGVAGIADYQCRQILRDRYCRLAPVFPAGTAFPMDAVDKIPSMIRFAEETDLTGTARWIETRWMG